MKTYANVAEMVEDLVDDSDFLELFLERLERKQERKYIVKDVLAYMSQKTEDGRVEFLWDIFHVYCRECGGEQPESGRCQCTNDE